MKALEFNLKLYVLILKSLSCENVSDPFIVQLAARETGAVAALVLFSSRLLKTPFPSILWVNVPFKTTLPAPVCVPELKTLPAILIVLALSFMVPRTRLKSFVTLITLWVPAKFKAIPAVLSMVRLYNESGAARLTVNV